MFSENYGWAIIFEVFYLDQGPAAWGATLRILSCKQSDLLISWCLYRKFSTQGSKSEVH